MATAGITLRGAPNLDGGCLGNRERPGSAGNTRPRRSVAERGRGGVGGLGRSQQSFRLKLATQGRDIVWK
jgi:hypothetical protein